MTDHRKWLSGDVVAAVDSCHTKHDGSRGWFAFEFVVLESLDSPLAVGDECAWVTSVNQVLPLKDFLVAAWTSCAMFARIPTVVDADRVWSIADALVSEPDLLAGAVLAASVPEGEPWSARWRLPDGFESYVGNLARNVDKPLGRAWLRSVLPVEMREHVRPGNELVLWDWCCEWGIVGRCP